jgi:hypothetical protein
MQPCIYFSIGSLFWRHQPKVWSFSVELFISCENSSTRDRCYDLKNIFWAKKLEKQIGEFGSNYCYVDSIFFTSKSHHPKYTMAGFPLTTHSSSLLRWQVETIPLDHATWATENIIVTLGFKKNNNFSWKIVKKSPTILVIKLTSDFQSFLKKSWFYE